MLRTDGPGMPERGEFRDGEGAAALGPQLWGGESRNLRPEWLAGRAALTAAALRPTTRVGPKRQNQGFGDRMS